MIELDEIDLRILDEVGEITRTYYTTEPKGNMIEKDGLISCIEDLIAEVEHLKEELEYEKEKEI